MRLEKQPSDAREIHATGPTLAKRAVPEAPASSAVFHGLLQLQKLAGNSAVCTLVASSRPGHLAVQRDKASAKGGAEVCPSRSPDELATSRSTGFLPGSDVVTQAGQTVMVADFPVNSATLPHDVASNPTWERLISTIIGDRTIKFTTEGYTDCVGATAQRENLSLRQQRADAVFAAMPEKARSRLFVSEPAAPAEYVDTNDTSEGRARNRAVKLVYLSTSPKEDPGVVVPQAQSFDEYVYLVRSLERKLKLTAPSDVPTALSVVRQIYYGSAPWSRFTTPFWHGVITARPWSPGSDPTPALGAALMSALKASKEVEGTEISHVLTGLDAMMKPGKVAFPAVLTPELRNEAAATWAGDLASAARAWVMQRLMLSYDKTAEDFFDELASTADLLGDIDSFAIRVGLDPAQPRSSQVGRRLNLRGPLSDTLLAYYRTTHTSLGEARRHRIQTFIEAYGGHVKAGEIENRDEVASNLRPQIREFAFDMMAHRLVIEGKADKLPKGSPDSYALTERASTLMTGFFLNWLASHLRKESST
jgi:outer membrane protein OmpA-like peptidoglycan-associated protein